MTKVYEFEVPNVRDLGGYKTKEGKTVKEGLLIRGVSTSKFKSEHDKIMFNSLNIKTIFDLRSDGEIELSPDYVPDGAEYYNLPGIVDEKGIGVDFSPKGMANNRKLFNDKRTGLKMPFMSVETFMNFYKGMFFNKACYGKMFDLLLDNKAPLYFHCTAGKDRTGVGAILILLALGVRRKDAEQDYLYTNVCLKDKIDEEILKHQKEIELNPQIENQIRGMMGVDYTLIGGILDQIENEFGGYTNYLNEVFDLNKEQLTKLRDIYTK